MEHSALHAVQLLGLFLILGGPLLVLGAIKPALRRLGPNAEREGFAAALEQSVVRWVLYGAMAAILGIFADFVVQSAELAGKTVLGGVNLSVASRFALHTSIGQLSLARGGTLLLIMAALRFTGKPRWWFALLLGCATTILSGLVSHAAAQPHGRAAAITLQAIHLFGGAVWLGVLLHLLAMRTQLETEAEPSCLALTAEIVRRFSPVALSAVCLLLGSGAFAAVRFVGNWEALFTSPYGITLMLKLMVLSFVLFAGYRNYATHRPALLALANSRRSAASESSLPTRSQDARRVLQSFGRTLELEVTCGILLIAVAGILGSVSPPGPPGIQRLTAAQAHALSKPHLPPARFVDPNTFYGASERAIGDLRYSEFMHGWSGVAVCLLGGCWLAQERRTASQWPKRLWPALLLLFGLFIAGASDPEVWLLRRVNFWQAVSTPEILEHQLGAALALLLAGLAWRAGRKPETKRRSDIAIAGIMILGSLMLLGHAHSTLTASDQLTSLINVQHAVLGIFGLLAGMLRWLDLRGLVHSRIAGWAWPAFVVGLGIFMAFFYREVV